MRSSTIFLVLALTTAGLASAEESDPGGEVRRILNERRPELCRCIERGVDIGHLVGVTLRFEIDVRGRAMQTDIDVGEDISPAVARCLKRSVERIHFPEATAFSTVEHRMSFLNTHLDRPRRR